MPMLSHFRARLVQPGHFSFHSQTIYKLTILHSGVHTDLVTPSLLECNQCAASGFDTDVSSVSQQIV